MGQSPGKKISFGEGLYTQWLRTDLLVMCAAKKTKWHHFAQWFPRPQHQHQQRRVTTLSTPTTTELNEHNAGSPNDACPLFGQGMLFLLIYYYLY